MTFEQLYYFTEVYRLKSITQAAENLYVSRQALSLAIKKLESEFNIELFDRLTNGVKPTKAGDSFYQSAQNILKEQAILQQNMLVYAPQSKPLEICTIGLPESLMPLYGQQIFNTLSAMFPHTYFDLHLIDPSNFSNMYEDFTISIITPFTQRKNSFLQIDVSEKYVIKQITTYPIYIWISSESSLCNNIFLTFDLLKDFHFCNLNHFSNSNATINYLKNEHDYKMFDNYPIIDLAENFIDRIEQFNYFTLDVSIQNHLSYTEIFGNRNVIAKATPYSLTCSILYNKILGVNFYPIIAGILTS